MGISKTLQTSPSVISQSQAVENYRLLHYSETSDISGLSMNENQGFYAMETLSTSSIEQILEYPEDRMMVHFTVLSNLEYFDRYPDSLMTVLSRIGGLLALLKVGFVLRLFHRAHSQTLASDSLYHSSFADFEKKIQKEVSC